MYCPKCKQSNLTGTFCATCGGALQAEPVAEPTPTFIEPSQPAAKAARAPQTLIAAGIALVSLIAAVFFFTQSSSANGELSKLKAEQETANSQVAANIKLINDALDQCSVYESTSGFYKLDDTHYALASTDDSDVGYSDAKCVLKAINAPSNVVDDFIQIGYADGIHIRTFNGIGVSYSWDEILSHPNAGYLTIWVETGSAAVAAGTA